MDNAGNTSEVYKTKNPYYKDSANTSDGNPAEQLPESANPTKPGDVYKRQYLQKIRRNRAYKRGGA